MTGQTIVGGALTITDDGRSLRVEHVHIGGPIGWTRPTSPACSGTWTSGPLPSPVPDGYRVEREVLSGRSSGRWRCVPQVRPTPTKTIPARGTIDLMGGGTPAPARSPAIHFGPQTLQPLSRAKLSPGLLRPSVNVSKLAPRVMLPSPGGTMHTATPAPIVADGVNIYPGPPRDTPPPYGVQPGMCDVWQGPVPANMYAQIPTAQLGQLVQIWSQPGVPNAPLWWRACFPDQYQPQQPDPYSSQGYAPAQDPYAAQNPSAAPYGQQGPQLPNPSYAPPTTSYGSDVERAPDSVQDSAWSSDDLGSLLAELSAPAEPVMGVDDVLALIAAQTPQPQRELPTYAHEKVNANPPNDGQLPPTGMNGVSLFNLAQLDGNAAGSQTWDPSRPDVPGAGVLAPRSLLTEQQQQDFPTAMTLPIIGACSFCSRAALTQDQYGKIGDFWGDFTNGLSTADHVFDQVWQGIKGVVPYGNVIDQVHQARMNAMYGQQGGGAPQAPTLPSPTAPAPRVAFHGFTPAMAAQLRSKLPALAPVLLDRSVLAIKNAQDVTRRARKKDPVAQQQIVQVKEAAAAGDPAARRVWRVMTLVMLDDDQRIAGRSALSSSVSSSSSSASPTAAALPSPRGPSPAPSAPKGAVAPFGGLRSALRLPIPVPHR